MELKPCPFCGGEAEFEREGNYRQSCIVSCRSCGARHESSDEDDCNGATWNLRADSDEVTELKAQLKLLSAAKPNIAIVAERDALAAQNRELMEQLAACRGDSVTKEVFRRKALSLHDLSTAPLERFRDEVIEECLRCYSPDDSYQDWADKIRALKKGAKE